MNQNFAFGLFILLTCLNLFANAQDWKTLENDDYTIDYPDNWQTDESGQMGTSFILLSPQTSDSDDFKENVNLLRQDLSAYDLNLEEFVTLSKGQIESMIEESEILESEIFTNVTPNYFRTTYTGKQYNRTLHFTQYYWVTDNSAYVLTFTSELDVYDDYKKTGEQIMKSFKLKAE